MAIRPTGIWRIGHVNRGTAHVVLWSRYALREQVSRGQLDWRGAFNEMPLGIPAGGCVRCNRENDYRHSESNVLHVIPAA